MGGQNDWGKLQIEFHLACEARRWADVSRAKEGDPLLPALRADLVAATARRELSEALSLEARAIAAVARATAKLEKSFKAAQSQWVLTAVK